ncbi:UNVERIFIED_CONTAM: hypothetical protein K2H54_002317 [Gekko kuhli]
MYSHHTRQKSPVYVPWVEPDFQFLELNPTKARSMPEMSVYFGNPLDALVSSGNRVTAGVVWCEGTLLGCILQQSGGMIFLKIAVTLEQFNFLKIIPYPPSVAFHYQPINFYFPA